MVPSLFGIRNSNRDFSLGASWGKNQFNNAFPVALACYMNSRDINPVYFKLDEELNLIKTYISTTELFGMNPTSDDIFYQFECKYSPFENISDGGTPGIDLVTKSISQDFLCLKPLEIKLTTLPDHTTCELTEDMYGSEIVVRPDTIVYQALSFCESFISNREGLVEYVEGVYRRVRDWNSASEVASNLGYIVDSLNSIMSHYSDIQKPLLMQPVWKTRGKSAILADNCLDIFVWSDYAFTKLFIRDNIGDVMDRNNRTIVWLFLMICQFAFNGRVNHRDIIDRYTYGTKNDKAFAISGARTNPIMRCEELRTPRIRKEEIRRIILNGGQNYLSPERRFDGVIQSDTSLFE